MMGKALCIILQRELHFTEKLTGEFFCKRLKAAQDIHKESYRPGVRAEKRRKFRGGKVCRLAPLSAGTVQTECGLMD